MIPNITLVTDGSFGVIVSTGRGSKAADDDDDDKSVAGVDVGGDV
jgi:hypothetical protein